jgi:sugar phosphate permease
VLAAGTVAQSSLSAVLLGLPVLAPALRAEFDLSVSEVGIVLASVWVGPILTLLPWGVAADRVGERAVLAVGLALMGALVCVAAFVSNLVELVAVLGLASAAGASVNAASGRAVMSWFGRDERGLALGVRQSALPIGGFLSALALPPIDRAGGLEASFLFLGALCLVASAAGALVLRDAPSDEGTPTVQAPVAILRDRRLWTLSGGSALYVTTQVSVTGFVVLFLHDQRGLSTGAAAAVLAVAQAVAIGLRIGAGRWSDRSHARVGPLRLLGFAIAAAVAVSAALVAAPLVMLLPSLVVSAALAMSWNGLAFTAAAELAGRARSGTALGFQQTSLSIAGAVAPIAFAAVVEAASWRTGFAVAALLPLGGVVVLASLDDSRRAMMRRCEL